MKLHRRLVRVILLCWMIGIEFLDLPIHFATWGGMWNVLILNEVRQNIMCIK